MVRTLITPDKQNISIKVPKKYIGKKVEVIAFMIDETLEAPALKDKIETHFATETILAKDWLTPNEDIAWQDL